MQIETALTLLRSLSESGLLPLAEGHSCGKGIPQEAALPGNEEGVCGDTGPLRRGHWHLVGSQGSGANP